MSTGVPAGKVVGVPAGICVASQSRLSSTEVMFCIKKSHLKFQFAFHFPALKFSCLFPLLPSAPIFLSSIFLSLPSASLLPCDFALNSQHTRLRQKPRPIKSLLESQTIRLRDRNLPARWNPLCRKCRPIRQIGRLLK